MANGLPAPAVRPVIPLARAGLHTPGDTPHPCPPNPLRPLRTLCPSAPLSSYASSPYDYASSPYGSGCDCDCAGDIGETGDGPDAWELGGGGALLAGGVGCAVGVPGGGEAGGVGPSGRGGEGFGCPGRPP